MWAPCFFQFSLEPTGIFWKKYNFVLRASICDVLRVKPLLGVDPTQSYWGNTKSPNQEFIDFAIKTRWKMIVFHKFLTINCYFHIIFVWFYYILMIFNWNNENKFLKFLEICILFKFLVFMINKILWNWSKTSICLQFHIPIDQVHKNIAQL